MHLCARSLAWGVVPYFSLESGFLTGKYQRPEDIQGVKRESILGKYFDERGMRILAALKQVAEQTGAAQASISLAWLMAQPTVTAPIASATSVAQLQDLFAAVELKLTPEQMKTLSDASAG